MRVRNWIYCSRKQGLLSFFYFRYFYRNIKTELRESEVLVSYQLGTTS